MKHLEHYLPLIVYALCIVVICVMLIVVRLKS